MVAVAPKLQHQFLRNFGLSQNSNVFLKQLINFERFGLREWQNRISPEKMLQIDGVDLSGDLQFYGFDGKHVYFHAS